MKDHPILQDMPAAARRSLRPESRFVDTGRAVIHYLDEGAHSYLSTLVVLSAQWLGANAFDGLAFGLRDRCRVIRVDLPGHGLAGPFTNGDYSARAYADAVLAVLNACGANNVVLVGQSHSGIPAVLAALDEPTRIKGLILATSSGLPRGDARPPGGQVGEQPADPRWMADKLRTLMRRDHDPAWLADLAEELAAHHRLPWRAREAALRAAAYDNSLLAQLLPRLSTPGITLWSSHSTYLPVTMAERIATLWPGCIGSGNIDDTGHLLLADAPADGARAVLSFMEQIA